jgi:hypothetical protein
MLENESVLTENLPVADGVEKLCAAGLEAFSYLDDTNHAPTDWKKKAQARIDPFVDKRFGDLLIQIAPGIQMLVAAVPGK